MAGRFADSMGHYPTGDVLKKWTNQFNGGASITHAAPAGRAATDALFMVATLGGPSSVSKTLDYQNGWTVGFAMYLIASTNGISGSSFYQLYNNGAVLGSLAIQPDSTVSFTIGTTTVDFPALAINPNQWYYFEIQTAMSAAGAMSLNIGVNATVRINGVQIIATGTIDSGVVISSTLHGDATANRHTFNTGLGINGGYVRDLYILDNTGSISTTKTFLGDITVSYLFPNADNGVAMSINPNTGTHFSKVNENPADYDTTYIYSPTAATADDFLWQHIPAFTGTIPFVHYGVMARKDDQGTRTIKQTIGGVAQTQFSLGDNYLYYFIANDGPWTVASFNAEDFGIEVFS